MKKNILILSLATATLWAEESPPVVTAPDQKEALAKHREGSTKLADDQDLLSADVQDLVDSQTNPKVIQLLSEVETLMAEATDELEQQDTSGETIAIETEIIEKIFEAAKEKSR